MAVTSGAYPAAADDRAPSALQAETTPPAESPSPESPSTDAPSPGDAPSEPDTTSPPAPEPASPPSGETAPDSSVGTLPDAEPGATEPGAAGATEPPSVTDPAAEEPRTWNDPTAAMAAAEAAPSTTPSTEDELDGSFDDEPMEPAPKKDPKGFGMTMVGALTFSPQSGHAWAQGGCPVAQIDTGMGVVTYAPGCSASPAGGISGEGRLGYMLGFVGFELYGQIATDYVNARLDGLPPIPGVPEYATQMHIGRIGIGGGGHVRFKTPPGAFRLSAGAGGGFLVRALFSNVSSLDGSSENYVAPVLRADVGIVLASVLTLGVMGWLEFAPTVTITPDLSALGSAGDELQGALTETVVMQGTQGFVGLFGGFAFGK